MHVPAPPERVFPLLCPVREHDWIEGWRAEVVRSESGVAEAGCVFVTPSRGAEDAVTWVIHHHEPCLRIGFTLLLPGVFVELLDIRLQGGARGTELLWSREATALGERGAGVLRLRASEHEEKHRGIERALAHYLETGRCLARSA